MNKNILEKLIEKLLLQIQILQIQLKIKLLNEKRTVPNLPKPKYVILHHGAGIWSFEQVNRHHKNIWGFRSSLGFYIGYNKWIGYAGRLYIARRDNEIGAHTVVESRPRYWNTQVGIGLQGNFEKERPTERQLETLERECDAYRAKGSIIIGHWEVDSTICPGYYLKQWLTDYRSKRSIVKPNKFP